MSDVPDLRPVSVRCGEKLARNRFVLALGMSGAFALYLLMLLPTLLLISIPIWLCVASFVPDGWGWPAFGAIVVLLAAALTALHYKLDTWLRRQ
jgi:hypothetical protein